jgi:hypothetical protein
MQPILRLIASQPELLVEHARAYAALVSAQTGQAVKAWRRQALFGSLGLCLLGVSAVLGGVAVMLWAMLPAVPGQATWALLAVPLPPLILALACLVAARRSADGETFTLVREQVLADLAMLRQAGAT